MCRNNNISKEDIVKLFDGCCRTEYIYYRDNDDFKGSIIKEYIRNNRTAMKVKIYFEKDKNANPYYSSNERLHCCSKAMQELCSYIWKGEMPLNINSIINGIYRLLFDDMQDIPLADKIMRINQNAESYIRDIVYYLTNNIIIISRWAGGFRSNIDNDCEFEAEISVFNSISKENIGKVLDGLCEKYDAKWVEL